MALVDLDDMISLTEVSQNPSRIVEEASNGRTRVVLKHNEPVAAVVSIEFYKHTQRQEEELLDLLVATSRVLNDSGEQFPLDDVLEYFEISKDELDTVVDD